MAVIQKSCARSAPLLKLRSPVAGRKLDMQLTGRLASAFAWPIWPTVGSAKSI